MLRFVWDEPGPIDRREWLRIGGLGALLAAAETTAKGGAPRLDERQSDRSDPGRPVPPSSSTATRPAIPGFGKAKSVIVVFASGGQSQLDTWDPKPDAPREIRGEFDAVPSSVPGTFLCEHMPRIAAVADKYTLVRSMSHEDLDHGSAFYLSMTGRYHNRRSANPPPSPNDHPCFGSVYKRLRPNEGFVESAVHINGPALVPRIVGPGQNAGFLGRDYDPMVLGDVTSKPIVVPGLARQRDLPQARLDARRRLMQSLDREAQRMERSARMADMNTLYQRAFQLLADPKTRNAFNLSAEPNDVRNRYGRNRSGQACLLARRLVEAGVPVITVMFNHTNRGQDDRPGKTDFYGWDTHNDIFSALKQHLLPRFDLAFSALLEDLDERGLLDDTLVLCLGEFGRAPLVAFEARFAGQSPGRKHWAAVYSIVAAGAGVGRGQVLGASDRRGAYPASEKYGPWDVTATIFSALGIDPAGHYTDSLQRRFPLSTGRPITALYSSS